MAIYLGILLFSFFITGVALVPFIDLLYRLNFVNQKSDQPAAIPVGGGILIIALVTFLYIFIYPVISRFGIYVTTVFNFKEELNIIFFTFISFGLLGFYDDIVNIFKIKKAGFFNISLVNKLLLQFILSLVVSLMLYQNLHIDIINIPYFGVLELGWLFIPSATLIIYFFSRAFSVSDHLDGYVSGLLTICLLAFWAISVSLLDTTLSVFIALLTGSLIAFLYFNVYPARILLGQAGSLSFGASLAVIGLLLGKTAALLIIGGIFVLEMVLHLAGQIQAYISKNHQTSIYPLHVLLLSRGWPAPKITLRAWLAGIILAIFGLWLAGA